MISTLSLSRGKQRQVSGASRLLLLLSRLELDERQHEFVCQMACQIEDWSAFSTQAARHFLLPLAYHHLSRLDDGVIPSGTLDQMRKNVLHVVARTLAIASAQRHLVEDLLNPFDAPFALVKGYALSSRYYDQPAFRFCRDIDVLVSPSEHVSLIQRALSMGYRFSPRYGQVSNRDLQAMARYQPEVSLVSPTGIMVEFHRQLDKSGYIFDTDSLLAETEKIEIDGTQVSTLTTTDHFVYLCLHHTRHLWSHLHWLTDVDALKRHDDYNEMAIRKRAHQLGLDSTVDATLDFFRVMADVTPNEPIMLTGSGGDLVNSCLENLSEGPTAERVLRQERPYSDFAFSWQAESHPKMRSWLHRQLILIQPGMDDYHAMPLPMALHWTYYIVRPVTGLWRRMSKLFKKH